MNNSQRPNHNSRIDPHVNSQRPNDNSRIDPHVNSQRPNDKSPPSHDGSIHPHDKSWGYKWGDTTYNLPVVTTPAS